MRSQHLFAGSRLYWVRVMLAAAFLAAAPASWLSACDTPVYRYAMYRWPAANYFVFFLHSGEPTETQRAVNAELMALEEGDPPRPNVAFYDVSTADLEVAPRIAVEHWKKLGSPESAYIVIAPPPLGGVVYAGDLNPGDVAALVDSPMRKRMASLLEEGMATVFVVLEKDAKGKTDPPAEGSDGAAADSVNNATAIKTTEDIVTSVREGRLQLYSAPPKGLVGAPEESSDKKPQHQIAMLRLRRDDPQEQWLVRMLLAVESDLHEFDQPMVFPVYGRGRVHPPLIGLGISDPNLVDAVQFLTGACSCTVKEENPGVDLLTHYDWDSAAVAVAEKFGAEEGNEQLGAADLFPELIIPGPDADAGEDLQTVAAEPNGSPANAGATQTASSDSASSDERQAPSQGNASEQEAASSEPRSVASSSPAPGDSYSVDAPMISIWAVAVALVVLLAGLFLATLVILRPR